MGAFDSSKYGMKYLNIECQRFSVAQNSNYQENWIELVVEADQKEVIGQFSAKEIVGNFHFPDLIDEIGFEMCLEHFYGVGNHDHVLSVASSAPDLLEALEGMVSLFPEGVEDDGSSRIGFNENLKEKYRAAVKAIAKAKGEAK